ncbi:DOMON-like domain-containing protein [Cyanobium sp. CH-040]|nr:DOMON-like domain-containing protein [Cyanobium sp. CH-040]
MLAAELVPHAAREALTEASRGSALSLHARAERLGAHLRLGYDLCGPLEQLRIPPLQAVPLRRDGLWQHTCLEAFLAVPGREGYWELNLAPSGDWNWYQLDGYRRNLRPDPALEALPLAVEHSTGALRLQASLPLPPPLAEAEELELALTAVLEHADGGLSYWALVHPAGDADFHWRGGWRRCR